MMNQFQKNKKQLKEILILKKKKSKKEECIKFL